METAPVVVAPFRFWRTVTVAFVLFSAPNLRGDPSLLDQLQGQVPSSISGNPAAENALPGTGLVGRALGFSDASGIRLGGLWLADGNYLISGGAQPGTWSWNSALIVGMNLDAERLVGWNGASFAVQFLQFNGEDTNGQAGSVQGYNSLPGPEPLNRSELYQLWLRQSLFEDKLIFRIGKSSPTYDFNNVARPVPTQDEGLAIPSVTSLLYTPVFVNPTLLGAIGGYYNSVYGITVTVAPTKNTYLSYGFYDGNIARGVQTGLRGPKFNGYYFNIWEIGLDWVVAERYPGQFGMSGWYQSGRLQGPSGVSQDGTGGFYLFGSQRIWGESAKTRVHGNDKNALAHQHPSISAFVQYGINDSDTLPVNQYFGVGFTGFNLVPHRKNDSVGVGMAWSWLNPNLFQRASELMFQGYYQAELIPATFFQPAISYIPIPGAGANLSDAWAATFRVMVLF